MWQFYWTPTIGHHYFARLLWTILNPPKRNWVNWSQHSRGLLCSWGLLMRSTFVIASLLGIQCAPPPFHHVNHLINGPISLSDDDDDHEADLLLQRPTMMRPTSVSLSSHKSVFIQIYALLGGLELSSCFGPTHHGHNRPNSLPILWNFASLNSHKGPLNYWIKGFGLSGWPTASCDDDGRRAGGKIFMS